MLSLYGAQVASYIVPLVTIPYLARVLGAVGWGLVAFAQALGSFVAFFAEYGFAFSATREVARHRKDRQKLTGILAGVLGAKGLLAAALFVVAVVFRSWIPIFREHPALLWAGMFWAFAQAFNMMWFFQGFERMQLAVALDISANFLATIGIFIVVRRPEDGWRVLAVQGCGFLLSFIVGLGLVHRDLSFRLPSWSSVWGSLRMGWSIFLFRSSLSLYTVGNAFILGLFVSPQVVGYYAGAERISKGFVGLFTPVSQTLYPRLSHLVQHDRDRAACLAKIGIIIMGVGGAAIGSLVFVFAPLLVRVILGRGFAPVVPALRVLSLLVPVISVNSALGIQRMLPLGLDRALSGITVLAGLVNVGLAAALARSYAALGMSWSVVSAEIFVTAGLYLVLRRRILDRKSYSDTFQADITRKLDLLPWGH